MRPYASAKTIKALSFTCFRVFGALGQLRGIGPKHPKSWGGIHRNLSKMLNTTFHIKWGLSQVERPSEDWLITVLLYFGHLENLCKLGLNSPNNGERYAESNMKCLTPHFTLNEALLKYKGHLKVELYMF